MNRQVSIKVTSLTVKERYLKTRIVIEILTHSYLFIYLFTYLFICFFIYLLLRYLSMLLSIYLIVP